MYFHYCKNIVLRALFLIAIGLNIYLGYVHYFPKEWKTYLHNHNVFIYAMKILTDNPVYKSLFPAPPVHKHHDFILAVYQSMKDIHELFEKHKIIYFTDGGTTLGVIRHKGMIPWDTDLDLMVPFEYDLKIQALEPELEKLGYTLSEVSFGYKILTKKHYNVNQKTGPTTMRVCCDLFLIGQQDHIVTYLKNTARKQWPNAFHDIKDLYPLVKRSFGRIEVYTPKDPIPYLDRQYGKNWRHTGYDATHSEEVSLQAFKLENFKPAEPFGPLQDRVQ